MKVGRCWQGYSVDGGCHQSCGGTRFVVAVAEAEAEEVYRAVERCLVRGDGRQASLICSDGD